jgi:hypothetical protein
VTRRLVGSCVLFWLGLLVVPPAAGQAPARLPTVEGPYTVFLESTGCDSTRRMRCRYQIAEVAASFPGQDRRRFHLVFYLGADQVAGQGDAIQRLDRLFGVVRHPGADPSIANTGTVGDTRPALLRIEGTRYKFSRESGDQVLVDIDKRTRP